MIKRRILTTRKVVQILQSRTSMKRKTNLVRRRIRAKDKMVRKSILQKIRMHQKNKLKKFHHNEYAKSFKRKY
jgi:hypothetical protein